MTSTPNSQNGAAFCQFEPNIVIDLSELPFASAADVSLLIWTPQRVEKCGVRITLTRIKESPTMLSDQDAGPWFTRHGEVEKSSVGLWSGV
jgi:hypothetical protein